MTVRLGVSVEGPTEQEFCRDVLAPHLAGFGIVAESKVIVTKRVVSGPDHKGGAISVDRVVREIRPLLYSFDHVTTLYDFYKFGGRVPQENVEQLCLRVADRLNNPSNVTVYVQLFEFEALLSSNPDKVGDYFASNDLANEMTRIVQQATDPERINDGETTAPSKQLANLVDEHCSTRYDKKFHGPQLAAEIGLDAIRSRCQRFDSWLKKLETLHDSA